MFLRYFILCLCFISHFAFSTECKKVFSQETERHTQAIEFMKKHFTAEELAKIIVLDKYTLSQELTKKHFTAEEMAELMKHTQYAESIKTFHFTPEKVVELMKHTQYAEFIRVFLTVEDISEIMNQTEVTELIKKHFTPEKVAEVMKHTQAAELIKTFFTAKELAEIMNQHIGNRFSEVAKDLTKDVVRTSSVIE